MSETLGVGSEIAGYRVIGLLGRGGMGFVYEAEHAILGRKAAIKTLSDDLGGDGDFRERFIQESRMVAALDHPSIIPIYDAGEENGVVYIAMRHVGGGDLQGLIAQGQIEVERARLDPRAGGGCAGRGARARPRPSRRQARERADRLTRPTASI